LEHNEVESEKACQSLANSLEKKYLTPIIKNPFPWSGISISNLYNAGTGISISDLYNAGNIFVKEYYQTARGPAKEKVFQHFAKVQNKIFCSTFNS